jgi:hypothetical protein
MNKRTNNHIKHKRENQGLSNTNPTLKQEAYRKEQFVIFGLNEVSLSTNKRS